MTGSPAQQLQTLRDALVELHKTLVDMERTAYEKTFGSIHSPYDFLQLLFTDPWFAWLRPISGLIVAIDETMAGSAPVTSPAAEAYLARTRELLVASEDGGGFSGHYFEALQRDPSVILAHAEVAKHFGRKRGSA